MNAVDTSPGTPPVDPSFFPADSDSGAIRFGMPHALVISVCVVVAAVLAMFGMNVKTVLLIVAGAAGSGGTIVLLVTAGGRGGGRWARLVRAYLSAGN